MRVDQPKILEAGERCKIQVSFTCQEKAEVLWYRFPREYKPFLTHEKLDGFVVGLLLLAMKTGEDMELEGAISEKLLYNLTNYYMAVVEQQIPSLRRV